MGMSRTTKVTCLGGYAFFLLGVGLFLLVPSSILMGIYANAEPSNEQIIAFVLFALSFVTIAVGLGLTVYWCTNTTNGQVKDPEETEPVNNQQNGKATTRGSVAKATDYSETNGGSGGGLPESAAKYESPATGGEEEDRSSKDDSLAQAPVIA